VMTCVGRAASYEGETDPAHPQGKRLGKPQPFSLARAPIDRSNVPVRRQGAVWDSRGPMLGGQTRLVHGSPRACLLLVDPLRAACRCIVPRPTRQQGPSVSQRLRMARWILEGPRCPSERCPAWSRCPRTPQRVRQTSRPRLSGGRGRRGVRETVEGHLDPFTKIEAL
jgi:hypothetical protein